jgi:hypothetical protein
MQKEKRLSYSDIIDDFQKNAGKMRYVFYIIQWKIFKYFYTTPFPLIPVMDGSREEIKVLGAFCPGKKRCSLIY